MVQSKYWCFTLNNPTDDEVGALRELGEALTTTHLVIGNEVGEGGTPHIQGFIIFATPKRFETAKRKLGRRVHLERANGTPFQAYTYCCKDGNYEEFGEIPINVERNTGNRGQFVEYVTWCTSFYDANGRRPNEREIAISHPALFVRYRRNLETLTAYTCPSPNLQEGELRGWQIDLNNQLHEDADDRTVTFVVDPEGGKGKSFFMRWFYSNNENKTQLLSVGKRDDLAHCIDTFKTVFLFDIPRGGMEFLQYVVLEKLKDRVVFSPKYDSTTKLLNSNVHVVVFSNEGPCMNAFTHDRYNILNI